MLTVARIGRRRGAGSVGVDGGRLYSPAMGYGVIPVAAVAGAVRGGVGVIPGTKVRLLRGSGEDAVQRGGTATAEQGSGAGRSCAGEARFRVAARADDGVRGIRGVLFKGRRVTSACAPGREGAARSQAGITAFSCAAGGEEDDPDVWVRPGSEGGTGPTDGPGGSARATHARRATRAAGAGAWGRAVRKEAALARWRVGLGSDAG